MITVTLYVPTGKTGIAIDLFVVIPENTVLLLLSKIVTLTVVTYSPSNPMSNSLLYMISEIGSMTIEEFTFNILNNLES